MLSYVFLRVLLLTDSLLGIDGSENRTEYCACYQVGDHEHGCPCNRLHHRDGIEEGLGFLCCQLISLGYHLVVGLELGHKHACVHESEPEILYDGEQQGGIEEWY